MPDTPRRWSKNAPDYNNDTEGQRHMPDCGGPEACYICKTDDQANRILLDFDSVAVGPEGLPSHYEGYGPPEEEWMR